MLQSLSFRGNNLGGWSLGPVQSFSAAIAGSKLQSLNLSNTCIIGWDLEHVKSFGAALAKSKLQSLDLSEVNLGGWYPGQLRSLGAAIVESKLQSLNLSNNYLNLCSLGRIRSFSTVLAKSSLKILDLRYNNLGTWCEDKLALLIAAIKMHPTLIKINTSEVVIQARIDAALVENKRYFMQKALRSTEVLLKESRLMPDLIDIIQAYDMPEAYCHLYKAGYKNKAYAVLTLCNVDSEGNIDTTIEANPCYQGEKPLLNTSSTSSSSSQAQSSSSHVCCFEK